MVKIKWTHNYIEELDDIANYIFFLRFKLNINMLGYEKYSIS